MISLANNFCLTCHLLIVDCFTDRGDGNELLDQVLCMLSIDVQLHQLHTLRGRRGTFSNPGSA